MRLTGQVIRARHLAGWQWWTGRSRCGSTRSRPAGTPGCGIWRGKWGSWSECIETIDEDLGVNGPGDRQLSRFLRLTLVVACGEVGVVLGLDSSRLWRSTAERFELLRWLRLTDTLFAKQERAYDLK